LVRFVRRHVASRALRSASLEARRFLVSAVVKILKRTLSLFQAGGPGGPVFRPAGLLAEISDREVR
jgi:hypothetical protein